MSFFRKLGDAMKPTLSKIKTFGKQADKFSGKALRWADRTLDKGEGLINKVNDMAGFDVVNKLSGGVIDTDTALNLARTGIEKGKHLRKRIKKDYDTLDQQFGNKENRQLAYNDIRDRIAESGLRGGLGSYANDNLRVARGLR